MKTRVLASLLLLPLLVVVYFGGYVLLATSFLLGCVTVWEFYRGCRAIRIKPSYAVTYLSICGLYAVNLFANDEKWYMAWFFLSVLLSLLYLFKIEKHKLEDALATVMGIFYIVFFSFHIGLVGQTGQYAKLIWIVVLSAMATDTFAYFAGYLFGKHKLCPHISPKKTVEGAIGGSVGSILVCGVFGWLVFPDVLVHCLILGFLCSIAAEMGDLTASIFKRKMGIKDYGNLIPGHGGILDRFDSYLFTGPIVYYYIMLIIK